MADDERFRGPKGDKGDKGDTGATGSAGHDAEISDIQLAAISNAVIQQIKSDPDMRPPDVDELTTRILERLPDIEVRSDRDSPAIVSLSRAAKENRSAVMILETQDNFTARTK